MSEEVQEWQQPNQSNIASEDPSYHAIKVYNTIEDGLWDKMSQLEKVQTLNDFIDIARDVRVLLLRGDKVWNEIKHSIGNKASSLKIKETSFAYNGELNTISSKILMWLKVCSSAQFLASNGSQGEQGLANEYLELPPQQRVIWLTDKLEKEILEATELWGDKAADIGFTMPINIKDAQDPFL